MSKVKSLSPSIVDEDVGLQPPQRSKSVISKLYFPMLILTMLVLTVALIMSGVQYATTPLKKTTTTAPITVTTLIPTTEAPMRDTSWYISAIASVLMGIVALYITITMFAGSSGKGGEKDQKKTTSYIKWPLLLFMILFSIYAINLYLVDALERSEFTRTGAWFFVSLYFTLSIYQFAVYPFVKDPKYLTGVAIITALIMGYMFYGGYTVPRYSSYLLVAIQVLVILSLLRFKTIRSNKAGKGLILYISLSVLLLASNTFNFVSAIEAEKS